MAELEFTVPGKARGKGRPRVTKLGVTYTPAETVNAEAFVKQRAFQALAGRPMLDGALRMTIEIIVEPPKTLTKARRAAIEGGKERPTSRPDLDNCIKLVADALNGIAYRDDAAIAELHVRRRYGARAETWVHILELEAAAAPVPMGVAA